MAILAPNAKGSEQDKRDTAAAIAAAGGSGNVQWNGTAWVSKTGGGASGSYALGGGGGGAPKSYDPAYGGIPNLPAYTTDIQKDVGTDKLGQLISSQPDFLKNLGLYTGNITSNLAGEVSQGTTNQLAQQAAEFGIGSGMPGSGASTSNFLARYGLTSEGLTQQGGKDYMGLMSSWPFQETQTASATTDQSANQAVFNAAPNPMAKALQEIKTARDAAQGSNYNAWAANRALPSGIYSWEDRFG